MNRGVVEVSGSALPVIEMAGICGGQAGIGAVDDGQRSKVVYSTESVFSGCADVHRAVALECERAVVDKYAPRESRRDGDAVPVHVQDNGLLRFDCDRL